MPEWPRILGISDLLQRTVGRTGGHGGEAAHGLRAILDAVPAAIVISAPDGTVALWNRGAVRAFGWRREEVEGKPSPFAGAEDAAQEAALRQRVLAGNEVRDQATQRTDRDGDARHLIVNAAAQHESGGTVSAIIAVMEDVTERRRADADRAARLGRLAAILDAMPEAVVVLDDNGIIAALNPTAVALLGYSEAEVRGRGLSALLHEPGDHSRFVGARQSVAARRKDGTTLPADFVLAEGRHDSGRVLVGVLRPQPRKDADASAKFLSLVSHDLRQPIQALSLVTGALERRVTDPAARDLVEHLGAVVRSTQATFEAIVEWTKLEGGQIAAVSAPCRLGETMASLAEEFEEEAKRRGLTLSCVPSSAMVRTDPVILRRVLRPVLDNALKFTPSGTVLLGARRHGRLLRLVVADSGQGIPADQRAAVFAPFSQLDAGREAGGLGLGLAIAQRLAGLIGTQVDYRSIPGKGTLVWVDVPRAG